MPCAECGASVPRNAADHHACDPRRRLEFQLRAMAAAATTFENDLREYLAGKEGRFEVWLAARDVRRTA
jgi:hypothetical protein